MTLNIQNEEQDENEQHESKVRLEKALILNYQVLNY